MEKEDLEFWANQSPAYSKLVRELFPRYEVMHGLASRVLEKRLPPEAHILVAGAGTGYEAIHFVLAQPGWHVTAEDPSPDMVAIGQENARREGVSDRITWVIGEINQAPKGLFDAATAMLVTHFIPPRKPKIDFLSNIARRLKPGSPLLLSALMGDPKTELFDELYGFWAEQNIAALDDIPAAKKAFRRRRETLEYSSLSEMIEMMAEAGFQKSASIYQELLLHILVAERA